MNLYDFTYRSFGTSNKAPLVFFFCGMGTRIRLYKRPIQHLVDAGFMVIAFDFEPRVIRNGEPDAWLALGSKVSHVVTEELKTAKARGIADFSCFGTSMGTLMAIKCASDNPDIKKVILNMTYGSVAENIWTWRLIRPAKHRAEQLGYTLASLDKKLAPFSPIPNASKLKGKKVLLYLARRDKVLLYTQSIQFKHALEAKNIDLTYVENKYFGHLISGYLNFKRRDVWLDFLKQPTADQQ